MRFFALFCSMFTWMLVINLANAAPPPRVVVGIKPVHSLTAALMAGVGEPLLLVTGKEIAFNHVLSPAQKSAISNSDLLIWTGKELEPSLATHLEHSGSSVPNLKILGNDALKMLPARYNQKQNDPFFWLDVRNAELLVDLIAERLLAIDPGRSGQYEINRRTLNKKIAHLERELEYAYRDVSWLSGYLYHDTQYYFEQSYGFRVDGIIAPTPYGKADIAKLLAIIGDISTRGKACLFYEAGLNSDHLSLLQNRSDIKTVELDSLGINLEPGKDLYEQLIKNNFSSVRNCLLAQGKKKGTLINKTITATTASSISADTSTAPPSSNQREDISESTLGIPAPTGIGGRFLLMDQYGRAVLSEQFSGKFMLVFFGYINCPDVCPNTLYVVSEALDQLAEKANMVAPIFITVDPERDTAPLLRDYLRAFRNGIYGLTGAPELVRRAADRFKVRYEKVQDTNAAPGDYYAVNHTASLFLLGQDGQFITKFAYGISAEKLTARLLEIIP